MSALSPFPRPEAPPEADPRPAEARPEELPLDILYEDETLLVLNKAAGVVVHPAAGHEEHTLVNALFLQNNGAALVTLARGEKNPEMKKDIVSKLSLMKSKEAMDYLMELLK